MPAAVVACGDGAGAAKAARSIDRSFDRGQQLAGGDGDGEAVPPTVIERVPAEAGNELPLEVTSTVPVDQPQSGWPVAPAAPSPAPVGAGWSSR